MSKFSRILLPFATFILGFYIGYLFFNNLSPIEYKEKHSGQKRLTNKLLDYDIPPSNELGNFKSILEGTINKFKNEGKAQNIAIYFRDLNNGPWFGVNSDQKFIPASLLKVPLMIAYFKEAESNPSVLNKKIKYVKAESFIESVKFFDKGEPMKDGQEYTVSDLIKRMIIHSDNEALYMLSSNISLEAQSELYTKLGFPIPQNVTSDQEFISPRNIGSIFRVLYNATYLSEEMSERALTLLTETDFENGIVAGVPDDIVVAQKYGERGINDTHELHDCGIIYYPNHPYTLCIMTEGKNMEDLSFVIKEISRITYEQVKASNPR